MLKLLRQKHIARRILWTIASLIIPVFVLWGVSSAIQTGRELDTAGYIFGKKVSMDDFLASHKATTTTLQLIYGNRFSNFVTGDLLEQRAWDRLIQLEEARRQHIRVDSEEVVSYIQSLPVFQANGGFDLRNYEYILHYSLGVSPQDFEKNMREDLQIAKLRQGILADITPSDAEVRDAYRRDNEKAQVSYILIPDSDLADRVSLDESELETYYRENSADFLTPAQVNVRYAAIKAESLMDGTDYEEKDIESYYDRNEAEFLVKEHVRRLDDELKSQIRQSLAAEQSISAEEVTEDAVSEYWRGHQDEFRVEEYTRPLDESVRSEIVQALRLEQAKRKALKLSEQLEDTIAEMSTPDMQVVAEAFGLAQGETGLFWENSPIPVIGWSHEFSQTAFGLEVGDISQAIEIGDDYYFLQPIERKEPAIPPLAEVRERVERQFRREKAHELAKEDAGAKLKTLLDYISEGKTSTFRDAALDLGYPIEETEPFNRSGYVPGIGLAQALADAAFTLSPGDIHNEVLEVSNGWCLIQLDQRLPISEADYKGQYEKYFNQVAQERSQEKIGVWYEDLLKRAQLRNIIAEHREEQARLAEEDFADSES
ncbi:MAG: peptidyl-prolyl cis-trans isomerase [Candidatus Omnitrophica bacterium]|nr:peptidyl-prolyl cis-trans isomerase [Candidatus Omnitrophota bacterium]